MKILITSVVDLEKSAPSRLHFFIKYLGAKHEITVISIRDVWKERQVQNNQSFFSSVLSRVSICHPFNLEIVPIWQEFLSFLTIKRLLRKIQAESYDLHFSYNSLMLGYLVARYLKEFDINTVYDLADNLPAMVYYSPQIPFFLKPLAKKISQFLVNQNIQISSEITITCRTLQEELRVPAQKTIIVPNGIDLNLFKQNTEKKHRKTHKKWRIGYIGVLREWVDFKPIFKAIKKLDKKYKISLKIVGREGDFRKIVNLAKEIGIEKKVDFWGHLSYGKIPFFLANIDIGILPFKNNEISKSAFPLKLLEYVAAKLPIISTPLPEVKKMMGKSILYAEGAEQWRECLENICQNYSHYLAAIYRKSSLLSRYDWKVIGENLEKVLLNYAKMRMMR